MQTNPDERRRMQSHTDEHKANCGCSLSTCPDVRRLFKDFCDALHINFSLSLSSSFSSICSVLALSLFSSPSAISMSDDSYSDRLYLECEEDVVTQKGKKMTVLYVHRRTHTAAHTVLLAWETVHLLRCSHMFVCVCLLADKLVLRKAPNGNTTSLRFGVYVAISGVSQVHQCNMYTHTCTHTTHMHTHNTCTHPFMHTHNTCTQHTHAHTCAHTST